MGKRQRNEWLWSKMPISWQIDPEFHKVIRSAPTGAAIAALKLYIGLCLKANYAPKDGLPKPGCAKISLSQLCALADLSRPMVVAGLKLLNEWEIVESLGGRPVTYYIIGYELRRFAKLPNRPLYGSAKTDQMHALAHMPNRGKSTLHALQLYLYLASVRDKDSYRAQVSYDQFCKMVGISRNRVSAALSALSTELITVRTAPVVMHEEGRKYSTNEYWLRGSRNDPFIPSSTDYVLDPNLDADTEDDEDEDFDSDDDSEFDSFFDRDPPQRQRAIKPNREFVDFSDFIKKDEE